MEFVLIQPGCPCCCSEEPILLEHLDAYSHGIAIHCEEDAKKLPDTVEMDIWRAPDGVSTISDLYNVSLKTCINTGRKVTVGVHAVMI